jgi:hypothetical protein
MSLGLYRLRAWQTMKIDGVVYTIKGMVEFRQGPYGWKEYELWDNAGKQWWLSVEREESIPLCSLFRVLEGDFFTPDEKVIYEGRTYTRRESGRAEVVDFFGLPNVQVADVVEFEEYGDESGLLLSRERWPDRVEYGAGTEFSKDKILLDGAFAAGQKAAPPKIFDAKISDTKIPDAKMTALPLGQELQIRGTICHVQGIVRYRQNSFTWTEYKVAPSSGLRLGAEEWLAVEGTTGDERALSLHSSIPFSAVERRGQSVVYSGVVYDRVEEGKGKVTWYDGDVDFEGGEVFAFSEYRSRDNAILTLEYWEGEQEASLGKELAPSEVTVLGSRKRTRGARTSRSKISRAIMAVLFVVGFVLPPMTTFFVPNPPLIEKQLASSRSFTSVTSVTLQGDKKAQVYSTPLSLDEACRAVIRMDSENLRYVTVTTEDPEKGERMLETSRETVMIYESESGETYVQVNANDPGSGRYTAYRPLYPFRTLRLYNGSRRWHRAGQTANGPQDIDTTRYTPVVASARQASVNARRSSGGGGRFGK